MKVFHDEFKNKIKSVTICRLKGHLPSEWMQEQWAPGHGTGSEVRKCLMCGIELGRRGLQNVGVTNASPCETQSQ